MRRRVAIAAVVLAGALAAWWWWLPPPETAPGEAIAASGPDSPRQISPPLARRVEIRAAASATPGPVFTGRVSSSLDGSPVPRATVTFFLDGAHDAVTDEAGAFRFEAPRPGTYELRRVAAEGFAPYEVGAFQGPIRFVARPGAAVSGIELELAPLIRCTGLVYRDDEPVEGARVRCSGGDDGLIDEVTTGADGSYSIRCVRMHLLTVAGEQWIQGAQSVGSSLPCRWDVDLPSEPLREPLARERILNVRVIDVRGQPVPRAIVICRSVEPDETSIQQRSRSWQGEPGSWYRADESGAFRCGVLEGKEASAFVPGVPGSERRTAPDTSELTLEVPSVGSLRGRVRDFDGAPVPSFRVSARSDDGQSYDRPFISADGSFDLGEVIPGRYRVRADRPGFPSSEGAEIEVSPGTPAEVTLTLQEGLSVHGVVLDAATRGPIAGARIASPGESSLAAPVGLTRVSATTDFNGRFALKRFVLLGDSLTVSAPGYVSWELGGQELKRGEITIELTPTTADAGTEYGGVGLAWKELLVVARLAPGGPAERAGVVIGDRLIRIDGAPLSDDLQQAVEKVRGPPGTQIELGFDRQDGGELDVTLRRERIPNPW
ncbi:MAG TPA: carboxypeptidase regulatory-like domain-containing protein [Myxococcaceae bacterium]|jgi:hypothetical protein